MKNIKEKVLKDVVEQLALYKFSDRETKSAEERAYIIIHKFLAEVGKVIDELDCHCDFCKGKMKHNVGGRGKLTDAKELKQKLGIK